jgi:hypothetical protein
MVFGGAVLYVPMVVHLGVDNKITGTYTCCPGLYVHDLDEEIVKNEGLRLN